MPNFPPFATKKDATKLLHLNLVFFIPQIVSLGVHDGIGKLLAHVWILFRKVTQNLFHAFPFGVLVSRAGIFYNRHVLRQSQNVAFLNVDHWANQGHSHSVHVGLWLEGVQSSFVEQT